MFKKSDFKIARLERSKKIEWILNHITTSKIKTLNCEIKLGTKKQIEEQLKCLDLSKSKGVYGIFVDPKEVINLQIALNKYRDSRPPNLKDREAVPFSNMKHDVKSGCLYIGKIREGNLYYRALQHVLGTKSKRTGALKLKLWARKLDKIQFSYIVFQDEDSQIIDEYERALWEYYQPAIGKL